MKSSKEPELAQFNDMVLGLGNKYDRDLIVMGMSFLDVALAQAIRTKLLGGFENSHPDVFDGATAPAGTLSAKIILANSLALIDAETTRECNILRKIRNDFSHSIADINCESPEIKDRIDSLFYSTNIPEDPFSYNQSVVVDPVWTVFPDGTTSQGDKLFMVVDKDSRVTFGVPVGNAVSPDALSRREKLLHSIWISIALAVRPAISMWHEGGYPQELDDLDDR